MSLYPILRRRNPGWATSSRTDIDRLFDRFFDVESWNDRASMNFSPSVDVVENENEIMLHIDLPGMKREDVSVKLENGTLTVSGERTAVSETGDKTSNYHIMERSHGKFVRSFSVPESVDADNVRAQLTDGVLNVALPKLAKAKPRTVDIDVKAN